MNLDNIKTSFENYCTSANQIFEDKKDQIRQKINHIYESTSQNASQVYGNVSSATATQYLCLKNEASKTSHAIENFVKKYQRELFYGACLVTTAYFAPNLFFISLIATAIIRYQLTETLRAAAQNYLKAEKNPFIHGSSPMKISRLDVTLAAIAAIDALALGTLFYSNSTTVNLIPVLGGIAAGSTMAKTALESANWFFL